MKWYMTWCLFRPVEMGIYVLLRTDLGPKSLTAVAFRSCLDFQMLGERGKCSPERIQLEHNNWFLKRICSVINTPVHTGTEFLNYVTS